MYIILLPVNATNGNHNKGFDQLSIANVKHPRRYYAHVLMGLVFNGVVIFVIYRELFFTTPLKMPCCHHRNMLKSFHAEQYFSKVFQIHYWMKTSIQNIQWS